MRVQSQKLLQTLLVCSGFGLLCTVASLIPTHRATAQVNNADLACYLHSPDGQQYDLSALCGGFTEPVAAQSRSITLGTGDVQVTLRWDTDADLDLAVIDPFGDEVSFVEPRVLSGGQLDVDANQGCFERMASPVENIFWPDGEGAVGDYTAVVDMFLLCNDAEPANYTLDILVDGEVITYTGSIANDLQESDRYSFTLAEGLSNEEIPAEIEGTSRLPGVPGQ